MNGDSFKATRIQNWCSANSTDSSLFRTGKCEQISSVEACEVCFMHQYGLHRVKDNVPGLCYTESQTAKPMHKCYCTP